MAATQTLAQLRTRAQRHADMLDPADAGRMTDADWAELLNQGIQRIYHRLVIARGHEYYVTQSDFSLVVDQTDYALPADHYLTLSVHASTDGSTGWRRVQAWQESQLESLWGASSSSTGSLYCRIQGTDLVFLPSPKQVMSIRHRYVPTPTRLSADSDTFDGIAGWEEAAVLDAAIAALRREQSLEEAAALVPALQDWDARIDSLAAHRHLTETDRIPMDPANSFARFVGAGHHVHRWEPGGYY